MAPRFSIFGGFSSVGRHRHFPGRLSASAERSGAGRQRTSPPAQGPPFDRVALERSAPVERHRAVAVAAVQTANVFSAASCGARREGLRALD